MRRAGVRGERGGNEQHLGAAVLDQAAIELGKAEVVADRQADGRARDIDDHELVARGGRVGLAQRRAARDVDVEQVDLAVARDQLAARIDHHGGVVGPLRRRPGSAPGVPPPTIHTPCLVARSRSADITGPLPSKGLRDLQLVALAPAEEREALGQHDELGAVGRGPLGQGPTSREVASEIAGRAHLHGGDAKLPASHVGLRPASNLLLWALAGGTHPPALSLCGGVAFRPPFFMSRNPLQTEARSRSSSRSASSPASTSSICASRWSRAAGCSASRSICRSSEHGDLSQVPEDRVDLEDCENLSRELSAVLDVDDPITQAYSLEVSSPGIDRPLRTPTHFAHFVGSDAKIQLATPAPHGERRPQELPRHPQGGRRRQGRDRVRWTAVPALDRTTSTPQSSSRTGTPS